MKDIYNSAGIKIVTSLSVAYYQWTLKDTCTSGLKSLYTCIRIFMVSLDHQNYIPYVTK